MAKTKRDELLQSKIRSLISKLLSEGKKDSDVIYSISGNCQISVRTATEHFRSFKAQKNLEESGFILEHQKNCEHLWSNPYCTPGGLASECSLCGLTKFIEIAK